jgi:WD40 repeat protein
MNHSVRLNHGRFAIAAPISAGSLDEHDLFSLAFTPDDRSVAVAGASGTIHLWDVPTGQELFTLPGHKAEVNGLAFSPDGTTLASCSHDGAVYLWRSHLTAVAR